MLSIGRLQTPVLALSIMLLVSTSEITYAQTGPGQGPGGPGGGASNNNHVCPKGDGKVVTLTNLTSTEYTVFLGGCPPYSPYNQTTPNTPRYQNKTITLRLNPVISNTVTYVGRFTSGSTSNSQLLMGYIGFDVNGVAILNDANALGEDAYVQEAHTMDSCRGHAEETGQYHFHSEPGPGCSYNDTAGRHSPLYGIMLDSIPLYGALGDNGVPPTNLDECGGHTDATYPFYHYHVTYNMAPPYVIKCFKGCVFSANGNPVLSKLGVVKTDSTCSKAAVQYNYSTFSNPWTALPLNGGAAPPPPPKSGASGCRWQAWLVAALLAVWTVAVPGTRVA